MWQQSQEQMLGSKDKDQLPKSGMRYIQMIDLVHIFYTEGDYWLDSLESHYVSVYWYLHINAFYLLEKYFSWVLQFTFCQTEGTVVTGSN